MQVIQGKDDAGFGVALPPGRHTIGRSAGSDVCLHDQDVSRRHAMVEVFPDGKAVISDTGSQNGTFVDGVQVTTPTALEDGSVVQIGADKLRWIPACPPGLRVTRTPEGHLEFDRVFAAAPAVPQGEVDLPAQEPQPGTMLTIG
jgi:S-DNA-T family DNA segregation ATPase FtsK/SpoIIIE